MTRSKKDIMSDLSDSITNARSLQLSAKQMQTVKAQPESETLLKQVGNFINDNLFDRERKR